MTSKESYYKLQKETVKQELYKFPRRLKAPTLAAMQAQLEVLGVSCA
jgi:hypothetical protein